MLIVVAQTPVHVTIDWHIVATPCSSIHIQPFCVYTIAFDVVELGDVALTVHEHPGHTEGSTSFSFLVEEDGQTYQVLIVNGASINPGKQMYVNPTYEGVGDDFKTTLEKQRALTPDVWVAAHGSQYGLDRKHVPGQPYSPLTFVDPEGYRQMVSHYERLFEKQVASELRPSEEPL